MSIWGSIKHGLKRAGYQVLGGVVGQPVGTVADGAENKGPGAVHDDAGKDKGHEVLTDEWRTPAENERTLPAASEG